MQLSENVAEIFKADISVTVVNIVDEVQHFRLCWVTAYSSQCPDKTLISVLVRGNYTGQNNISFNVP